MRWRAAAAGLVLVAGCSAAQGSAPTPLASAVASLHPLHSGVLDLTMTWSAGTPATAGFTVKGPFADPPRNDALPIFSLTTTRIGTGAAPARIVSDGTTAVAEAGSTRQVMTDSEIGGLRGRAGADLTGLNALGVSGWARGPETVTATGSEQTITSGADPVAAMNAIAKLADRDSGGAPPLQSVPPADAATVRSLLASSSLSVTTGKADHLLHGLTLVLDFAPSSRTALRQVIGAGANVSLHFTVTIGAPNQPVSVYLPPG